MLLLLVVCGLLSDLSTAFKQVKKCYGDRFMFPSTYAPAVYKGPLYFTPSNGGPQKLLMENGESKDPRVVPSRTNLLMRDLKVEDEGYFSVPFAGSTQLKILELKVLDCSEDANMHYGNTYTHHISSEAEILEFTPLKTAENLKLLWNRSNSSDGAEIRKTRKDNFYGDYWEIVFVTQKHSGYYNFRRKDGHLLSRIHLQVEENYNELVEKVGKNVYINYPWARDEWTATFRPDSDNNHRTEIKKGEVVEDTWFGDRIRVDYSGITINSVESNDEGTFEFRDKEDNVALIARLKVEDNLLHILKYVGIAGVIILALITCCCCYKCRSKRRANPVEYLGVRHLEDNQPPTYTSTVPKPTASTPLPVYSYTSDKLPAYNPLSSHVNRSQPQDASPHVQPSVSSPPISTGFLTSDAEPQYELKGMMFPSAPPLSSESAVCNVYTSEKLNFR